MKLLIKIGVITFIAMLVINAIQGFPLNETKVKAIHKMLHNSADYIQTNSEDVGQKKFQASEASSRTTNASAFHSKRPSADFF